MSTLFISLYVCLICKSTVAAINFFVVPFISTAFSSLHLVLTPCILGPLLFLFLLHPSLDLSTSTAIDFCQTCLIALGRTLSPCLSPFRTGGKNQRALGLQLNQALSRGWMLFSHDYYVWVTLTSFISFILGGQSTQTFTLKLKLL